MSLSRRDLMKLGGAAFVAATLPSQLMNLLGVRDERSMLQKLFDWDLLVEAQTSGPIPSAYDFSGKVIFDGLLYSNMENLWALHRLPRLPQWNRIFGGVGTWPDETTLPADEAWYDGSAAWILSGSGNNYLDRAAQGWWCMDWETHAGTDCHSQPISSRQQAATDFKIFFNEMKERMPNQKFGFYAFPMCRSLDSYYQPGHAFYSYWQNTKNEGWEEFYPVPDAFFPSLYWDYDRIGEGPEICSELRDFIANQIHEQRRLIDKYGRPGQQKIYPFVLPYRRDGTRLLPLDMWEEIFRTTYQLADGMVLWGGSGTQWSVGKTQPWYANYLKPMLDAGRLPGKAVR